MQVRLLGNSIHGDIVPEINNKLKKATKATGSVAFFTLGGRTDLFDADAWSAFRNGWMCVDLHFPTHLKNMKNICDRYSVPFFLHLDKTQSVAKKKDYGRVSQEFKVPDGLLHSKLLLIDYPDHNSEVIVGSHNWTISALNGLNIEQSVCIKDATDSPLINGFRNILESIKSKCKYFDTSKIDYFQKLQREASGGGIKEFRLDIEENDLDDEFIIFTNKEMKVIKTGQPVSIHTNDSAAISAQLVKSIMNDGVNATIPGLQAFEYLGSGVSRLSRDDSGVISGKSGIFYSHIIRSKRDESVIRHYTPQPVLKKEYWYPKAPEEHYGKVASMLGLDSTELVLEALSEEDAMPKHTEMKDAPYTIVRKPKFNNTE